MDATFYRSESIPSVRDVASDELNKGLLATLIIDRDTASHPPVFSPQISSTTLCDAFGQRQSLHPFYTQLNQYRVVRKSIPRFLG